MHEHKNTDLKKKDEFRERERECEGRRMRNGERVYKDWNGGYVPAGREDGERKRRVLDTAKRRWFYCVVVLEVLLVVWRYNIL